MCTHRQERELFIHQRSILRDSPALCFNSTSPSRPSSCSLCVQTLSSLQSGPKAQFTTEAGWKPPERCLWMFLGLGDFGTGNALTHAWLMLSVSQESLGLCVPETAHGHGSVSCSTRPTFHSSSQHPRYSSVYPQSRMSV